MRPGWLYGLLSRGNPKDPRREQRRVLFAVCLVLVGLPLVWELERHLCVTWSNSLRSRLFYLRKPAPDDLGNLRRGDYVRFRRAYPWPAPTDMLLKEVGCGPGDELTVTGEGDTFCNEKYLGRALATDSKGNPLSLFRYNGVIPEGSLFAVGHHPRTWDSRYFGFVRVEEVSEIAYPIL